MGQPIAVRIDYTADQLRRLARRTKDVAQARRLLAIAAVLDGASRAEAAKTGGMDRQTLRDWVIRFNEQGPDGLTNIPSPGVPPKLDAGTGLSLVASWRRAQSRQSTASCAGAPATWSRCCMRSSASRYRTIRSTAP